MKKALDKAIKTGDFINPFKMKHGQKAENLEEMRAVAKDKETDQPKKYVAGLSAADKKAHDKHLEKGSKKADDDKSAYKQSPADKKAKTKPCLLYTSDAADE